MSEVRLSSTLDGNTPLWRYMSLDKLIDLLATSELFFSPLSALHQIDPYEGYLPAVALQASTAGARKVLTTVEPAIEMTEKLILDGRQAYSQTLAHMQEVRSILLTLPEKSFVFTMMSIFVSCWHANAYESEAMWRIYSENRKAVAIESTAERLKDAIESGPSPHLVHINRIKYIDFFDATLSPQDCSVEGHNVPLLKRKSYEYENEVRAFFRLDISHADAAKQKVPEQVPVRMPINVNRLIKRIHVSPYAENPFQSSVTRVCEAFGLSAEVVNASGLLKGQDALLRLLAL